MAKTPIFTGSCTAIVTPYLENGVDYEKYAELIDFQYEGGTSAILVCGTTGENPTHTEEEHNKRVELSVKKCAGRMKTIVGVGGYNTAHVLEQAKQAEACGADGILMVTPYYNKSTQKGLIEHFTYVADRVSVPMILYNVPSRTGVKCAAETYAALSRHPNIQGVKEASGDFALIQKTRELCPEDFYIWSGNDDETAPIMLLGGVGVISVAANVAPREMRALTHACLEGDFVTAGKLQLKLRRLCEALFWEVNPIPVKTALNMMGRDVGPFRMPLWDMSESHQAALRGLLEEAGLLA